MANIVKIGLTALIGCVVGFALASLPKANATPQAAGTVHVAIIPVQVLDTNNLSSQNLPGVRAVGISCVPKPQKRLPDAAVCYVAMSTGGD